MKKLFIFIGLLTLISCSNPAEEEILKDITKDITIEIKVNETYTMEGKDFQIIEVPNNFVAEFASGIVKGKHLGNTKFTVKSENITYTCMVNVNANKTAYVDLGYLMGVKKNDILSIYGEPYYINKSTYYFNPLSSVLLEKRYLFAFDENDKVDIAGLVFNFSNIYVVSDHLKDRYELYYSTQSKYLYGNAYKSADASLFVTIERNNSEIGVTYNYP